MLGIRRLSRLTAEPRSAQRSVQLGPSARDRARSGDSDTVEMPESLCSAVTGEDGSRPGLSRLTFGVTTLIGGSMKLGSWFAGNLEGR